MTVRPSDTKKFQVALYVSAWIEIRYFLSASNDVWSHST